MLLIFGCLRSHVNTYKMRLKMPNVWIPPPPLPEGGIHHLWCATPSQGLAARLCRSLLRSISSMSYFAMTCRSWLYPVFMTSDADLVRTAGLDALMLCWTSSLGVQVILLHPERHIVFATSMLLLEKEHHGLL